MVAALIAGSATAELVLRQNGPHKVSTREAVLWSLAWVALAGVFNAAELDDLIRRGQAAGGAPQKSADQIRTQRANEGAAAWYWMRTEHRRGWALVQGGQLRDWCNKLPDAARWPTGTLAVSRHGELSERSTQGWTSVRSELWGSSGQELTIEEALYGAVYGRQY